MPDYNEQLLGRLLKLGCPIRHIRRLVREVTDHREDLKQAGLAEGLSEAEAETQAIALLGDPLVLADQMMTTVRRSSWWGRHYVITFALLPVLTYPVLWLLPVVSETFLVLWLGYGLDDKKAEAAAKNPVIFHHILLAFQFTDYLTIALVTLLFCRLARRAAVKLKWMMISGIICSLLAVFCGAHLQPNLGINVNITVSSNLVSMPLLRGIIPLLVAGTFYAIQRWKVRRLEQKMARCE